MNQEANRVLVIEDNKEHLMALTIKLNAHHYDVISAADGSSAMTVATREKPDAILLDLGLPGGDGLVVLKRLKSSSSTVGIPVIVVTGREPKINEELALGAGASAFLQKPVQTDDLVRALWKALTANSSK